MQPMQRALDTSQAPQSHQRTSSCRNLDGQRTQHVYEVGYLIPWPKRIARRALLGLGALAHVSDVLQVDVRPLLRR